MTLKRSGSADDDRDAESLALLVTHATGRAGNAGRRTRRRRLAVWLGSGIDPPRIGDSIVDAANDCWTILSIEERGAKTRLRCVTRNLQIVHQLDRSHRDPGGDLGGQRLRAGNRRLDDRSVPPCQHEFSRSKRRSTIRPTRRRRRLTYRVMLADDTPLDHNHRLVGPDGTIYQLVEYTQAERIDTLPMATVRKLANA